MIEPAATIIARVMGGYSYGADPASPERAICVNRPDGWFLYLEEDAGMRYPEESMSWGSLHNFMESSRAMLGGHEWPAWGKSEAWATGLASLLCGQAHRHGNGWVVKFERKDRGFIVLGDGWAEVYQDRAAYEAMGTPNRFEW